MLLGRIPILPDQVVDDAVIRQADASRGIVSLIDLLLPFCMAPTATMMEEKNAFMFLSIP